MARNKSQSRDVGGASTSASSPTTRGIKKELNKTDKGSSRKFVPESSEVTTGGSEAEEEKGKEKGKGKGKVETKEPRKANAAKKRSGPDPRLDPNIDPKRAKRIVANRESAARSKQKQKRQLDNLKTVHNTLLETKSTVQQEIDEVQAASKRLETENKALISLLHSLNPQSSTDDGVNKDEQTKHSLKNN